LARTVYSEDELMANRDYARPQVVGEHRLHGGFDAEGCYLPPRSRFRPEAIEAWSEALRERGGDLLPADASLLSGTRYPTVEQSRLLLREGLGQSFWNSLTIIGKIEARGRMLAELPFPDLQELVVEDISGMAIGHLRGGLLRAHGLDEGGEPDQGIGGHDVMWFAARDLAFGAGAYPDVEPPERIGREPETREVPELPQQFEAMLRFLMNLLLIEFRAELGFASSEQLLRSPDLFTDRRPAADEAADVIDRIRQDEEIHVSSLRLYLGELRQCHLRTLDGGQRRGAELLDPMWERLVHWATVEQPKLQAEQQRELYRERILAHEDGERILREFEALAEG
jgi:hypothetical protein